MLTGLKWEGLPRRAAGNSEAARFNLMKSNPALSLLPVASPIGHLCLAAAAKLRVPFALLELRCRASSLGVAWERDCEFRQTLSLVRLLSEIVSAAKPEHSL